MRVVLLVRSLERGGTERQVAQLAHGMVLAGHEPIVVTFYPGGALEQEARDSGARVLDLQKRGRWDQRATLRRLRMLLEDLRPDALYAFLVEPGLLAAWLRPGAAWRFVWGVRAADLDAGVDGAFASLSRLVAPLAARRADLIVANSHRGAERHAARGFPKDRMAVVPNGIDVHRFSPDRSSSEILRREWLAGGDELVGLVARVVPLKGHDDFLLAASRVHQSRPGTRFVCVGDGPEEVLSDLRARAGRLGLSGVLRIEQGRPDVECVYNALDVLCLASTTEGFPNVLAEAMACGVPCVATDVGDAARVVAGRGEVVPARRPDLLGDALLKILDRRRANDPLLAPDALRSVIVGSFRTELLAARTVAAIDQVISSSRGGASDG